ncbi:MAG: helix-turn-helix domain-containing protein [Clostridia bacterium]|nr:helix-turn-helix domain-containing protein [Clostridia bacterium]
MARPKKYSVCLSNDDVAHLKSLLKSKDTNETICNRCRILLDLDESHPPVLKQSDCAKAHGISRSTVSNTVESYCKDGLESLLKLKRSVNSDNARRKVDGRTEAKIITIACGPAPDGHSRWTLRLLEEQLKVEIDEPVGKDAIRRALKKTGFDLTNPTIGASLQKRTQTS